MLAAEVPAAQPGAAQPAALWGEAWPRSHPCARPQGCAPGHQWAPMDTELELRAPEGNTAPGSPTWLAGAVLDGYVAQNGYAQNGYTQNAHVCVASVPNSCLHTTASGAADSL